MVSALHLCLHSETVLPGSTWFDREGVQHGVQHVASVCLVLFWYAEVSSQAKETVDESTNCSYELLDRHCSTPVAQTQIESEKKRVLVVSRSEVGSVREATIERFLQKKCGGVRAPHAEGPEDSHEAGYPARPHGMAGKSCSEARMSRAIGHQPTLIG